MSSSGGLNSGNVSYASGVRPVIVLANDLVVERGTGTSENPYELALE